ncbi:hypothetical protein KUTeg_010235 [Tegillarca granosa]|uniref:U8 snoRNA-decapping enzyme n=1 Tax=Tegillarca granosa TaxID=220873 RepID=A0ABQ9F670_TEGGR|nr:hypothetical protein KUTeg_010235 [Tegillarca granosa]
MTDIGWGHLAQVEAYGRLGDAAEDYKIIRYSDSIENYKSYMKAAHAMIFAHDDQILWELYKAKAAVLMQMRFDGVLGFPGGLVEDDETPLQGINRELEEEINLDLDKYSLCDDDHVVVFCNDQKKLILHFYAKEVSLEDFKSIEMAVLSAPDYGNEVCT